MEILYELSWQHHLVCIRRIYFRRILAARRSVMVYYNRRHTDRRAVLQARAAVVSAVRARDCIRRRRGFADT